jgi:hypothetical protein
MRLTRRVLGPGELDHELLWGAVGLATLGLALAWLAVVGPLPFPCAFRALTGLPCPTCGATRALLALLAGEPGTALRAHPAVAGAALAAPALGIYAVVTWWFDLKRLRLECEPADRSRLRGLAWLAIAALWVFLAVDGR